MKNETIIERALAELVRRPVSDGNFVILEDALSKKFVQFTGDSPGPLQLDLPSQTLSEVEFYRAVALFRRLGIAGEEYDLLDAPGGVPVAKQFTFQAMFGSAAAATEVALRVFTDVYQFPPDFPMLVTKGWTS